MGKNNRAKCYWLKHKEGDNMKGASNAVLALSKALYGKRITNEQYLDLLACKNCNEIATYLRSNTAYEEAFEGSLKSEFSASALCDIVKKGTFSKFMYLYRFEVAIGQKFSKYFIAKNDIEQILKCTLLILSGKQDEYLLSMQSFLDKHLTINLFALAKATTLSEVADALKKTRYEKIYRECLQNKSVSYLDFEMKLNQFFEDFQRQLLSDCFGKKERQNMNSLISKSLDLDYVQRICRIIKYYANNDQLKKSVTNINMSLFTKRQVQALVNSQSIDDVKSVLRTSAYRSFADFDENDISMQIQKYLFDVYRKRLIFSSYPSEIMFAYMFLADNECLNIIKIIEGCNYNLSQDEIKASLVGLKL